MRACSAYTSINSPLLSVPGKKLQYEDVHNQMERCRLKGCNGMDCCDFLNVIPLGGSQNLRTCIAKDSLDDDCKLCCWILNGLRCVQDPIKSECSDASSPKNQGDSTIYPPVGNMEGLYTGCRSYEEIFPQLMGTYKILTDVTPMKHSSEQYVAQMVADDVINKRKNEFDGSHPVFTVQYTQDVTMETIRSVIDAYASQWLNDIHDDMSDQVDFAILNKIVHKSNQSQLPATIYCMDATQTCTLTGDNIAMNGPLTDETPTLQIGGRDSFNRVEWLNHMNVNIRDIKSVKSLQHHRQAPPFFSVGSNLMNSADTIKSPRLARAM